MILWYRRLCIYLSLQALVFSHIYVRGFKYIARNGYIYVVLCWQRICQAASCLRHLHWGCFLCLEYHLYVVTVRTRYSLVLGWTSKLQCQLQTGSNPITQKWALDSKNKLILTQSTPTYPRFAHSGGMPCDSGPRPTRFGRDLSPGSIQKLQRNNNTRQHS